MAKLLHSHTLIPKLSVNKNSLSSIKFKYCEKKKNLVCVRASLVEFSPDDFSVDRLLGTFGFMNLSRYQSFM